VGLPCTIICVRSRSAEGKPAMLSARPRRCLLMCPPRAWPVEKPSPHMAHAWTSTAFGDDRGCFLVIAGRLRWLVRWPPSAWNVGNRRPHVWHSNASSWPRRRRRRLTGGGDVPEAAWREPLVTSSSSSSLPPFILLLTEVVRARIYVCGSHGLKLHAWLGYIYGQLLHAVPSRLDETMTHITRCMPCRVHDSNVISVQSVY